MKYIVGLGNGMVILKGNILDLSPESKITALAAGVLYKEEIGEKIIFSGGHTKGPTRESEARKMQELIRNKFPDIPEEDILMEETSLDTAGNAFAVKKVLPENSKVILLSFAYHLPRARRIFKNFGIIPEEVYASDKVLKKLSPIYDNFINKFTFLRKAQKFIREAICLPLAYTLDPKGKFLRIITMRTRGGSLSFLPF